MKKLLSLILLLSISSHVFGFIPVIDFPAIGTEILKFAMEAKKWKSYITDFLKLKKEIEANYKRFKRVSGALEKGDIKELLNTYQEIAKKYKSSPYLKDEMGKDVWNDIFIKKASIKQKYKGIDDFGYIRNNKYYQANSEYRNMQESRIKTKDEMIKDIDNLNVFLSDFRDMQNKRSERLEIFLKKMEELGVDNAANSDKTAETSKIIALWSEMNYEGLTQNFQLLSMIRLYFEDMVKMRTRSMKNAKEYMDSIRGEAEAVKKLVEEE
jgi:hypothetical protein